MFQKEIVPVKTQIKDSTGNWKDITVSKDDGIRGDTTLQMLAKLKPVFKPTGSTTAGNASQMSDGAAASLLMKRSKAKQLGLPIKATFISFAAVGVPPSGLKKYRDHSNYIQVMGIGPAVAIPEALKKAKLSVDDIDSFEINEAFASQAVYCVEKLGIPRDKVNPYGGAIALGHPLGATGVRQLSTLIHRMEREPNW
jgi:acetyl-CoA acyltransferase 1